MIWPKSSGLFRQKPRDVHPHGGLRLKSHGPMDFRTPAMGRSSTGGVFRWESHHEMGTVDGESSIRIAKRSCNAPKASPIRILGDREFPSQISTSQFSVYKGC